MLSVEVYAPSGKLGEVRSLLVAHDGVDHVMVGGGSVEGDRVLVTAELMPRIVDALLPELVACGVPGDEIAVVHRDSQRPMGGLPADAPGWAEGALAWSELAMASRQYARAVPLYLTFMACAGVIADIGVLTRSPILVVGAMALSPDLLPLCATCVGIVGKRPGLAVRAFTALVVGLAVAAVAAFVVTALLRAGGYPAANGSLGDGGLGVLPTVNVATLIVAAVAGVAGVLAFRTRSSVAVGVAISITTIPAASFIGAAVAVRCVRTVRCAGRARRERGPDPADRDWDPRAAATASGAVADRFSGPGDRANRTHMTGEAPGVVTSPCARGQGRSAVLAAVRVAEEQATA